MSRTKERKKIIHEPSTQEIFRCLSCMPKWSQILYDEGVDKVYKPFLKWLIEAKYFEERKEKITIKNIAIGYKAEATKITKWLHEIYDDIIELNFDKSELFINNKIPVHFYIKHFDNHSSINLGVDVLPREYENVTIPFMRGKIGTDNFWVSRIEHEVYDGNIEITVWLDGGILNRFRELAVEEALFKGWLGFMDKWDKTSYQIDEVLINSVCKKTSYI